MSPSNGAGDGSPSTPAACRSRSPGSGCSPRPFRGTELKDADARSGWRLRLPAQAEQQGRGSRRHRAARHAQEHRQQRTTRRGSARRSPGDRQRHHPRRLARSASRPRSRRRSIGKATASKTPAAGEAIRLIRRPDARSLRRSPVLRLDGNKTVNLTNIRPPAKTLSLSAEALDCDNGEQAGRIRLRPRERRGQREARVRGRTRSERQELHASLRHRLRHPAARAAARRELPRDRRHPRHLRAGDAGPDDGRPAQEHAVQPDLQRLRSAGNRGREEGRRTGSCTKSSLSASTCSTR